MQPANETLLVGAARSKEVTTKWLTLKQKEWSKWRQFEATKDISAEELSALRQRLGAKFQIVSTRWVLTCKSDGTRPGRPRRGLR